METLKQANYESKIESVKNRTACSKRFKNHTSVPPKILKKYHVTENSYILTV